MYVAKFATEEIEFVTGGVRWSLGNDVWVPPLWHEYLRTCMLDLSLRFEMAPDHCHGVLLFCAASDCERDVRDAVSELTRLHKPDGLVVPADANEFDTLSADLPRSQVRINYEGFHHNGSPLACDFRLFTAFFSNLSRRVRCVYQVNLRKFQPDSDDERLAKKYLARLELELPFTPEVRAMQRVIMDRLMHKGWYGCEFLAVESEEVLQQWLAHSREFFNETSGRIGFPDLPVDEGEFSEWFVTGFSPSRVVTNDVAPCYRAASIFSVEAFAMLCQTRNPISKSGKDAATVSQPDVFISYSSNDAAHAFALCQKLEESGHHCWIAPRNVNRPDWPLAILEAIDQVQAVVVVVSDAANHSPYVSRELALALNRRLRLIPVLLQKGVVPSGQLELFLATCQRLTAYDRDFHVWTTELVQMLQTT